MLAIGDKVVCIDDSSPASSKTYQPNGHVKLGNIYCIESFMVNGAGELGIVLVGLPTFLVWDNSRWCWRSNRFRKVETRTDKEKLRNVDEIPLGYQH